MHDKAGLNIQAEMPGPQHHFRCGSPNISADSPWLQSRHKSSSRMMKCSGQRSQPGSFRPELLNQRRLLWDLSKICFYLHAKHYTSAP